MIFPLLGDDEQRWPNALRAILYALAMAYFFLGVAILADVFMASIDKVTSRRRQDLGADGKRKTSKVWNETVATLTLMALGSSAPEIFLSMIDIVKKKFHFGALGPSTIVGSAAFNLLVIVAVCVSVIPSDEVRRIENIPTFYITAAFSMVAYIWMAVILSVVTPEIVDLWEAAVTFLMLPVLVYVTYKTDRGDFNDQLVKFGIVSAAAEVEDEAAGEEGCLTFCLDALEVPGSVHDTRVEVKVVRQGSASLPPVTCQFHTEGLRASHVIDFEAVEGSLDFEEGESEKSIEMLIPGKSGRIWDAVFLLILSDAEGCGFDPSEDGGSEAAILTVIVKRHGEEANLCTYFLHSIFSVDRSVLYAAEWKDQVISSIYCNGSLEEQREATAADWVMHLVSMPWKVVFSIIPPINMAGGWACFYGSLGGIALLTACISDFAELFGCIIDTPDIVTAVTFVALGTSMPDLFASLSAAKEDETADASIVNVTGSNSVNVFLGLGGPWTVAALYWAINGRNSDWEMRYPEVASKVSGAVFVVQAKHLGFSVGAFCWVCILALMLLISRRRLVGAELGGVWLPKVLTSVALVLFWVTWVVVVSWRVLSEDASTEDVILVLGFTGVFTFAATVVPIGTMKFGVDADDVAKSNEDEHNGKGEEHNGKGEEHNGKGEDEHNGTGAMDPNGGAAEVICTSSLTSEAAAKLEAPSWEADPIAVCYWTVPNKAAAEDCAANDLAADDTDEARIADPDSGKAPAVIATQDKPRGPSEEVAAAEGNEIFDLDLGVDIPEESGVAPLGARFARNASRTR